MRARVDVERMMAEIRSSARARRRAAADLPAEPTLAGAASTLRRLVDESAACVDLYEIRGMPPSRFWIPGFVRPLLVATIRYVLAWQVHWNGVVARALAEILRLLERVERRLGQRLDAAGGRLAALERRVADLDGRRDTLAGHSIEFAARHRGDEVEIRARLEVHAARMRALLDADPSLTAHGARVVDLGCGRGELLAALAARDVSAVGVDALPAMVAACRAQHLDAEESDLFDWLEAQPPGSLAGALACQLVEHLSLDEVLELLARLAQALRPGAPLVLETVNVENLNVAAHTFHLDPTHRLKLPAATLAHLLRSFGFEVLDVAYLNPCPPGEQLRLLEGGDPQAAAVNENLLRLNHLLFGPRDCAVVARRPASGAGG